MTGPFYDDETILRLLMARYTFTRRNTFSQWRDLMKVTTDIDNISRLIKVRKLLRFPETKRHSSSINAALLRAKEISEKVMKNVHEGRGSDYAHMAKSMGNEDKHWGVEIFIAKAQDTVHKFRGHCVDLERATPQQAMKTCRTFEWQLHWFPLTDNTCELKELYWLQRWLRQLI